MQHPPQVAHDRNLHQQIARNGHNRNRMREGGKRQASRIATNVKQALLRLISHGRAGVLFFARRYSAKGVTLRGLQVHTSQGILESLDIEVRPSEVAVGLRLTPNRP